MSSSSEASLTPNNLNSSLKLIKKQFKRRRLFDKECEPTKRESHLTPLSERQQLAIALQLSSDESNRKSIKTILSFIY